MRKAVCPGLFDPPTMGHLDVVRRAAALFDHLTVAVLVNESKVSLFTPQERMDMLREAVALYPNVTVDSFSGLLVGYCREHDIVAIVKGLRAGPDFDYELKMAQMNHRLSGIDSVFLPTSPQYSYVASSLVKEVARLDGDVSGLVPDSVLNALRSRLDRTATSIPPSTQPGPRE